MSGIPWNIPAHALNARNLLPTAMKDSDKILNVIHKGPIKAQGESVIDCNGRRLMPLSNLPMAIQELAARKIIIRKTGAHTWDVVPSVEHMLAMPEVKPRQ